MMRAVFVLIIVFLPVSARADETAAPAREVKNKTPLQVQASFPGTPLQIRERFKLKVTVVNPADVPAPYEGFSCPRGDNVIIESDTLVKEEEQCRSTDFFKEILAPHGSLDFEIALRVIESARPGKHRVRAGFSQSGSSEISWGNPEAIEVAAPAEVPLSVSIEPRTLELVVWKPAKINALLTNASDKPVVLAVMPDWFTQAGNVKVRPDLGRNPPAPPVSIEPGKTLSVPLEIYTWGEESGEIHPLVGFAVPGMIKPVWSQPLDIRTTPPPVDNTQ